MDQSSIENIPINDEEPVPIITVRNAYKRYSKTAVVLRGLNMCVNKGSIYGLLGPSGCGKTTLLSCLVGRQILDSGTITLGLESKIQLGYMPQDISLYDGFNVEEIFMYFGLMLKKSKDYILARGKEFIDFLELPPSSRILSTLSGGQQRRVSMAVALLHDPELLILDEPTVGVDPLLSHKIWLYFLKITNEDKKTIIITTHYIEEAKNSHTIGLMRGGIILTEMCPTGLMTSLNCSSLEEAFLILSKKQENHQVEQSEYPKSDVKRSDMPFTKGKVFTCYRFKAQLHKNYWWTKRNIPITLFMLALPAALFIIFMWMLGGKLEQVKLATVRDELVPGKDDCENPKQVTSYYGCSTNVRLSCQFITYLRNQSYEVIEYKTLKEGIDAVKYNKTFALLHFPKNYTEALLERIGRGYKANNESIKASFIDAHLDNTVYVISLVLGRNLLTAFYNAVGPVITSCGINKKVIDVPPIKNNPPIYESSDIRYHPLNGYVISHNWF